MATIKLRPKQVQAIAVIQAQKQQLNAAFQDLNAKETTILELILEEKGYEGEVSNIKIDKDVLSFDMVIKPAESKKGKKGKQVALPVVEEK